LEPKLRIALGRDAALWWRLVQRLAALACALATLCLAADERKAVSIELEKRAGSPAATRAPAKGAAAALPPGIAIEPELTEQAAVAVALWNSPRLEAALAELGLARADLLAAGVLRNPTFQVLFPVGPKPFESVLQWPIELLWQRRKRVDAARLNYDAVSAAVVQSGLDLARDVRLAFAELLLAQRRAAIGRDNAALRERIAALTEKRLAAGDISEMDASITRADARSAADDAARRELDIAAARERLRLLAGLRGNTVVLRAAAPAADAAPLPEWTAMVERALAQRPDLRAAELQIETAAARARWERSRLLALVAPLLSVKDIGASGIRAGPGLAAEVPVFDRNQGGAARADADVVRATMRYAALRDQIEQEIREATVLHRQAVESLDRLRRQVRPEVEKTIRLAERAYAEGDAAYLFVLETTRVRFDIDSREADALAGIDRARIQLERGVGGKL
jgi:outer membrane protein, heavy metal efflux system